MMNKDYRYQLETNYKSAPTIETDPPLDGFLATKPSNTFLKALEKVLDGFVKNGVIFYNLS